MSEPALTIADIGLGYIVYVEQWDYANPSPLAGTDLGRGCLNHPVVIMKIEDDEIHVCKVTSFRNRTLSIARPDESIWSNYIPIAPSPSHDRDNQQLQLTDRETLPNWPRVELYEYYTVNIALCERFGGFPTARHGLTAESFITLVEGIRSTQTPVPLIGILTDPEPESNAELTASVPSSETPPLATSPRRDSTPGSTPPGSPDSVNSPRMILHEPDALTEPVFEDQHLTSPYPQRIQATLRRRPLRDSIEQMEIRSDPELSATFVEPLTISRAQRTPVEFVYLAQGNTRSQNDLPLQRAERTRSPEWSQLPQTPLRLESIQIGNLLSTPAPVVSPSNWDLEANDAPLPEPTEEPMSPFYTQDYQQLPYYDETTRSDGWAQWFSSVGSLWQWFRETLWL
ncbi:MAG: hypothetical protein M1836_000428 [Candelina mexicana]|nr:MAG: hypothetical protein M1836_000428 [Candelina mexicana]